VTCVDLTWNDSYYFKEIHDEEFHNLYPPKNIRPQSQTGMSTYRVDEICVQNFGWNLEDRIHLAQDVAQCRF
jgi:hypothetical protein